jgi:hypothetical protein
VRASGSGAPSNVITSGYHKLIDVGQHKLQGLWWGETKGALLVQGRGDNRWAETLEVPSAALTPTLSQRERGPRAQDCEEISVFTESTELYDR